MRRTLHRAILGSGLVALLAVSGASAAPSRTTVTLSCDRGVVVSTLYAQLKSGGTVFDTDNLICGQNAESRKYEFVSTLASATHFDANLWITNANGSCTPCYVTTNQQVPFKLHVDGVGGGPGVTITVR